MKNYQTIKHNRYTAEITYRDGDVKLSGLSNISWSGSSDALEVLEEYSTFLTKVSEEAKEFKIRCFASELEVILERHTALHGV